MNFSALESEKEYFEKVFGFLKKNEFKIGILYIEKNIFIMEVMKMNLLKIIF